jgi:hypothetical protein
MSVPGVFCFYIDNYPRMLAMSEALAGEEKEPRRCKRSDCENAMAEPPMLAVLGGPASWEMIELA